SKSRRRCRSRRPAIFLSTEAAGKSAAAAGTRRQVETPNAEPRGRAGRAPVRPVLRSSVAGTRCCRRTDGTEALTARALAGCLLGITTPFLPYDGPQQTLRAIKANPTQ
ncbi:unnamed protein product, partial [Ixodes persulcatus]